MGRYSYEGRNCYQQPSTEKISARMRAVFAFCVVLSTILPSCRAISAEITPSNELVVKVGSEINLRCTLELTSSSTQFAKDVLWYHQDEVLPNSTYTVINESITEVTVVNATFDLAGNYGCGFPGESFWYKKTVAVFVGLPPDPVQHLTCTTHTKTEVYCQWQDAALETNIWNSDIATYREVGESAWKSCSISNGDNNCEFTSEYDEKYKIRVETSNVLGSNYFEINFDTDEQVTPSPPQNVIAEGSDEDNSMLFVSWTVPEVPKYTSFKYRVYYRSKTTNGTLSKDPPGGFLRVTLDELTPYTEYTIEVSARSATADPFNEMLYWSENATTTEATTVGAPFGHPSDVRIKSEVNSAKKHHRIVELEWKPVPVYQWGSPEIFYKVTLIPQDTSRPGLSLEQHEKTDSHTVITFHDIDKYQTYKVTVQPFNDVGEGDISEFGNSIRDRTTEPGPPRNLTVTLDNSSVMSIRWDPPIDPNGLIYEYEVRVSGDAIFSSNNMTDQEQIYQNRVSSQATAVGIECKEFPKDGTSMQVWVSAVTKNYTHHLFQGNETTKMIHEVCKSYVSGPNPIFIGIFIPTTIIVSCIIALILWNFFKDTCKEPPEPQLPSSIIKNGQLQPLDFVPRKTIEKECFDDLKPKVNRANVILNMEGSLQQTNLNPYHASPRNEPKYGMERNHSHDSGVPDSPIENIDMVFSNSAFEDDDATDKVDVIPSVSRSISDDVSDWRKSCFSDGSQESDVEVRPGPVANPGGVDLGPMSLSSPTDANPESDSYFKLTLLLDTDHMESPYCSHDLKITDGQAKETSSGSESVGNYVKQSRLDDVSPTKTNFASTPYLSMTPVSPPPITTSIPNGYVTTEALPKLSQQSVPDNIPPEDYSQMTTTQGGSDDYLRHNAKTTDLPPVSKDGYIKHQSLTQKYTEYQDNYPDFNQNKLSDDPNMNHDDYIQHKAVIGSSDNIPSNPSFSESTSDSLVGSTMPYSKLSLNM